MTVLALASVTTPRVWSNHPVSSSLETCLNPRMRICGGAARTTTGSQFSTQLESVWQMPRLRSSFTVILLNDNRCRSCSIFK